MFCIEAVDPNKRGDDDEAEYVSVGSMRIDVAGIESHIRDQGSAAGECCDRLEANDQKSVIKEIATYAIMLVEGLMGVKAERDENNLPLDHDAPPVIPQQLVKLHPSKFIQDVLNAYRDRLEKFWTPEPVEEIEANHRDLIKMYHDDDAMRNAIDNHDANKLFIWRLGLCPPFQATSHILWRPRHHLPEHDVGRK